MTTTRPDGRSAAKFARASASRFVLLAMAAGANAATSPPLQPTLAVSAVATDNSELTPAALRRSDVIGDVDAGVLVRSRGARVTITGDAGLDFIGYANHTAPDRVLPRGHLDLNVILLEQALFFDGEAAAVRTRSDPLAAQSDTSSTANTVSTVSLRASPYFAHDFSSTLSANARSDTTITRNKADDSTNLAAPDGSTYQHDVVNIVRKPTPFGVSIDASHEDTTYQDDSASVLRTDSLQATLSAALDGELVVGLIGGREHALYSSVVQNDTTYGAMLQWRPSRRTSLDVDAEHHYFGTGLNLHLRDRLPLSTVDLSLTRTPSAHLRRLRARQRPGHLARRPAQQPDARRGQQQSGGRRPRADPQPAQQLRAAAADHFRIGPARYPRDAEPHLQWHPQHGLRLGLLPEGRGASRCPADTGSHHLRQPAVGRLAGSLPSADAQCLGGCRDRVERDRSPRHPRWRFFAPDGRHAEPHAPAGAANHSFLRHPPFQLPRRAEFDFHHH
jgi:hypothetical protein